MTHFIEPFNPCPLSQLPVHGFDQNEEVVYYFIQVGAKETALRIAKETILDLDKIQSILPTVGLVIRTGNWPFVVGRDADITRDILFDLVSSPKVPKGPRIPFARFSQCCMRSKKGAVLG